MDETRELDIDLRKIFYMMRTKVVYIILATFIFAGAAGAFTHFFIDPTYTATAKFYVYNNPDSTVASNRSISNVDITASYDLVKTYVYLLQSDSVLDKVAQDLNMGSADQIRGYISAGQVEDTLVFMVRVTTTNPEFSAKIANSIAKIAPDEIVRLVNAGGASVVDYAKVPKAPTAPNLKKNVIIGAIAGFIVSFAILFVYELFDTTITNANDLIRDFELPVLGTVPMLDSIDKADGTETDKDNESAESDTLAKPSSALLENLQSMKGEANNDKA